MNEKIQVKDNREWWGLRSSEDFMPHLEGNAFIQLQAIVTVHEQGPTAARFFFFLSFFFYLRKSGSLDVLTAFPGNMWGFFLFNIVQVNELLGVSALFSAFFWETTCWAVLFSSGFAAPSWTLGHVRSDGHWSIEGCGLTISLWILGSWASRARGAPRTSGKCGELVGISVRCDWVPTIPSHRPPSSPCPLLLPG